MSSARVATGLALLNAALLVFLLAGRARTASASQAAPLPVLRGSALEIVDPQGRVRASISVQPPSTVGGKHYPETVLLRLTDPTHGPLVKLTASEDGSALGLSDDADGGLQLFARDTGSTVRVMDPQGRVRSVWP